MIGISDAAQHAIVQAMLNDATIAGLVDDRVLDDVPEGVGFPYISLGPENWEPFEDGCVNGAEGVLQIDIWSNGVGRVECKAITEAVTALFNSMDAPIVPGGGFMVSCNRVVLAQVLADQPSRTRHGIVQLELTVEKDDP